MTPSEAIAHPQSRGPGSPGAAITWPSDPTSMVRRLRGHSPGFTILELLFTVAIAGTLAAIAVPNFLEAQSRAKVSRAKADLRALSELEPIQVWDGVRARPRPAAYRTRRVRAFRAWGAWGRRGCRDRC